ncbi:MAG: ATP synthase F1 subunit epsilon [Coriobacteriia bacterium]|nr:ATP synthase F1 subunit epsilon [Coriobacteriia bacterium]
MARTLLCEIVTPESIVYNAEVQMVVAMTSMGEVGILPLHSPLVTVLALGELRLKIGAAAADWEYFAISGGYMQVHEDKVIVLADDAVAVSQIDGDRAAESRERVRDQMAQLPPDATDEIAQCERDLMWCEMQLEAAGKRRS